MIVKNIEGFRRIWMFPRNIRRIYPWKIAQILSLLNELTEYEKWSGNQILQNAFCKSLEKASLKKTGIQYDPKSGGPRTYFSQLLGLGLIFMRDDKTVYLTKAGEDLADGVAPLPILQNQLLKYQYPSVYGNNKNVRINPQIKVKPFMFILELLMTRDIKYLTNEEIAIPVIYGHNRGCLEVCIEKILQIRNGVSLLDIIDNKEQDLYLPRSNVTDLEKINNIKDIGNTCKNYLQACCLISVEDEAGREKIYFSEDAGNIVYSNLEHVDEFIDTSKGDESFQRSYGAWDRTKDTRLLVAEESEQFKSPEDRIILSCFYELAGNEIIDHMPEDFIGKMHSDFGFPKTKIRDVIHSHLTNALNYFESTFIALSYSGAGGATEFEKAVCSLFEKKFYFKTKHTGQLKRTEGVGGFADVFAVALDEKHCAVIDTKASARYQLPSKDYRAMMHSYIPNYLELTDNKKLKIEFGSFVAGGFRGNINSKLKSIKENSGVACSAVKASDLILIAKKGLGKEGQTELRKFLCKSKQLAFEDF